MIKNKFQKVTFSEFALYLQNSMIFDDLVEEVDC